MAIFTSILNLLKKNPATDGADTFNIQTMLNDNWDKIDAAMALKGAIGSVRAATATNTTLSGLQTVDGVSLVAGDRVLVKNQTTGSQNGIYVASSGAWTRAADADSSAKLAAGLWGYVREGTVNGGKSFVLSNAGAVTLGTTALTFSQVSGAGAADDTVIGSRTATDSVTPAMTGTLTGVLSSLFTLVKGITGKSSALTGPAITLEATKSHVDAGLAHGAVSAPTASTMMARDSAGRAQVAAPSAAADIARKDTVDAAQAVAIAAAATDATTKANSAQSAAISAAATDATAKASNAQSAAISAAATDATTKANAVQSNLTAHIGTGGTAHAAATTSTAGFLSATDKTKLDGIATGAGTAGSATDTVIGNRTINDSIAVGTTDTDSPTNLFSKIGAMLRAITGKADWHTAPRTTLENAVKLNGDTMTGPLVLSSEPITAMGAATKQYVDSVPHSMAQQALINGNFDVWQRGTSFNIPSTSVLYTADRWRFDNNPNGGTLPTMSLSRQLSSDLMGSMYFCRLSVNGAGTGFGNDANCTFNQFIENGTKYLCGAGKKLTLSFWARSSISGKRLGFHLEQKYGSGGTPASEEIINGSFITLTSNWTRYTFTFSTNPIDGKTFGFNADDSIFVRFWHIWGATHQTRVGATTAETFRGAGNIDIAQVQVNTGDTALPFQPRSFTEELALCQRYYQKSFPLVFAPAQNSGTLIGTAHAFLNTTGFNSTTVRFSARMRITPSLNFYNPSAANSNWRADDNSEIAPTLYQLGDSQMVITSSSQFVGGKNYFIHWTADAEL